MPDAVSGHSSTTTTTTGTWTRNIPGADEDLSATVTNTGTVELQLTDLFGSVVLVTDPALTAPVLLDADEYGNPAAGQAATRYGWPGAKQRSTEAQDGIVLMGVRLYNPATGRFLSVDPVPGGNANAYDYVYGDPVGQYDLDGRKCWKGFGWACSAGNQVQKHWRGIAQVGVTGVAVVAGAACVAATAGICGGAIAGYAIAAGIGASAGVANYRIGTEKRSTTGYVQAALTGIGNNLGGMHAGRVMLRSSASVRLQGSFTTLVRKPVRLRFWRL
ncbi:RHS repeat-associated core domain-containing protein [Kitasatospora sp. NBC_00458]|uniref:RHS repeat-associated core domain-containing protein n=1 Tax=Kitasatospora sp. NBC_00458 TaxID=2903568 RepID=UPI002E19FA01